MTQKRSKEAVTSRSRQISVNPFFVVGIGASAGGLESLEKFFASVPVDSGMAYVVIQHLSPDFRSMMDELLARHTQIPIHRAEEGVAVEPNNIYLLPPKKEMIISAGLLHMADKDPKQLTLPIDHFFRSLAQDCGQHAIAVVLSGTGSDGSRGIQEVHKAGGLVLCEHQQSAKFDGMPIAAQETGVVDLVLEPGNMPAALLQHARSPHEAKLRSQLPDHTALQGVEAVFDMLRREYDIDFSHYKPTTVSRRIERRLLLLRVNSLDEYAERLRKDPQELNALYKDLLIGVTKFFRDEDPFKKLERDVIPDLLKRVPQDDEIRVWVAGCATGEEPYSIAILLLEALQKAERSVRLKIFATDVHKTSLEYAGNGYFDADRLAAVSKRRLDRYFRSRGDGYVVTKELRQLIVFAQHNVIKDAPFTNLDLITCRNLLIYFQPQAQKKAISMFHFGLKTGGVLMLGNSENPGDYSDEFETLDDHCKLYRKRRDIRLPADIRLPLTANTHGLRSPGISPPRPPAAAVDSGVVRTYDRLLDKFMPPSLLVNEQRQLVESFGGAERLLTVKGRRLSHDVLDLLDTDARTSIAGALHRVMQHGKTVSFSGVRLRSSDPQQTYRVSIEPVDNLSPQPRYYLILLEPLGVRASANNGDRHDMDAEQMSRDQFQHLENELRHSEENLQATIEELETSNEEMQATNEELVASNEELQSTNEELHSVNEELYTVNAEHQKKISELAELNQDMEHLLRSTDVATLFLDRSLCIRKFTPKIAECFHLMEHDIGRKIGIFSHRICHESLVDELQAVLEDGLAREQEVRDVNGVCYFLRLLPYHVLDRVEGVVLSMTDISALDSARGSIALLSAIVESSGDAIIGKDLDGKITSWNEGARQLYGFTAEEAVGQDCSLFMSDSEKDQLRTNLARLQRGIRFEPVEVQRVTKDGRTVMVSLVLSPIKDTSGQVIGASAIERDISQLHFARQESQQRANRTRAIVDSALDAIVTIDETGKVTGWNPRAESVFGYRADEALGASLADLVIPPEQHEAHRLGLSHFLATGEAAVIGQRVELDAIRKSGEIFPVELAVSANKYQGGYEFTGFVRDITQRRRAEEQVRHAVQSRDQFLALLSHELRNPLSAVRTATHLLNAPDVDDEIDKKSRRIIERQTAQMTRLLDDLLDVARITQNKINLNKSLIDLRSTVEDVLQSVQELANETQIQIELSLPNEPLMVNGDPHRLQQVQANLLTNAIKYSPSGGKVCLALSSQDGRAIMRVSDEGAGIESNMLERIFDLFVQSDETLDRSQGGMGVGLTLVQNLVQMHDGCVVAHSAGLGLGSEFEVRLPLADVSSQSSPALVEPADLGRRVQTVAVIEDQEDNRKMLESLLKLYGFEVQTASDGVEGIKLLQRQNIDAAIIDIGLPQLDGYEVARRIRSSGNNIAQEIKLIALTGYGQPQDVQRALEAGFDHHLTKPLQPDKLVQVLRCAAPAT